MSYGDPNNPYGAPQGQPPGYGYPQQPGQPGQPGYGYPSAPPAQPYGHPGGPVLMPGSVKAARVMLYVLGGFQAIGGLLMVLASSWFADQLEELISDDPAFTAEDADTVASVGAGVMIVLGLIVLAFAVWAILTAAKFATGRGGVRVSAIIYASLVTLFSVINLLGANVFALISLILGILVIVFCANKNGSYWFNRPPQY
ncbi:hypothetical protein HTV80_08520 [Streptomyces sp. Vc74B-19]|uniref:hypothetical protein n=1 Tax=unclassified Streptomyces TaxID=2593676 RepID=UPI001BFC91FC|nr:MULTISPECIES: hypothetical protein [unclassified Streptomyces]MBT3163146.1 hypothetical protein [Streptomyces sp. Vc74B-19]MCO4700329.1 hypothetical protein [Streptomyces sp. RO-S4]MDU0302165.1 hypothetical protein [Streptomyces sp. PAL114]